MKLSMQIGDVFRPYKRFHGIYIPEQVVKLPVSKLSQGAKIAYGRLCRYGGEKAEIRPRRGRLADEIGCSERQVDSYIAELKRFCLIKVERLGLGRSNRYYFLWHNIFDCTIADVTACRYLKMGDDAEESSESDLQNTATPSIEESQFKRVSITENGNTANAVSSQRFINGQIREITFFYRDHIDGKALLSSSACFNIERILTRTHCLDELKQAVLGFERDEWLMRIHRYRGIEWFFKDENQVENWLARALASTVDT